MRISPVLNANQHIPNSKNQKFGAIYCVEVPRSIPEIKGLTDGEVIKVFASKFNKAWVDSMSLKKNFSVICSNLLSFVTQKEKPGPIMFYQHAGYGHIRNLLEERGISSPSWLLSRLNSKLDDNASLSFDYPAIFKDFHCFWLLTGKDKTNFTQIGEKSEDKLSSLVSTLYEHQKPNWTEDDNSLLVALSKCVIQDQEFSKMIEKEEIPVMRLETLDDIPAAVSEMKL